MRQQSDFAIDFTSEYQDLHKVSVERLLSQFQESPVIRNILEAFVEECQLLSTAIVQVMEARTLGKATGVQLATLGTIVGLKRKGAVQNTVAILTEGSDDILAEDGDILGTTVLNFDISDQDFFLRLLAKIDSNFAKSCSVPEVVASIYKTTDVPCRIDRKGPMQVDVIVPEDTPLEVIDFLTNPQVIEGVDRQFTFPYPATLEVDIAYNTNILLEDGDEAFTEDSDNIITDNISLT